MDNNIFTGRAAYIITGTSGSGKTTVLKAFEDIDYYCVDNIPTVLLPELFKVIESSYDKIKNIAVGVDIREKMFLDNFETLFTELNTLYPYIKVIFVDAEDNVILKRFKETRRVHPLKESDFKKALTKERDALKFLRNKAQIVIDSSNFNVHQLKKFIYNNFSTDNFHNFNVNIVSFGFKNGILAEGDIIFDVRFLKNPYFVDELRGKSGKDRDVVEYIFSDSKADTFILKTLDLLNFLIPEYQNEGKKYVVIGIGCTGGIHRSVAISEALYGKLKESYNIILRHRDI